MEGNGPLEWIPDPCRETTWLAIAGAGLGPQHVTTGLRTLIQCADIIYIETYTLPGNLDWIARTVVHEPSKVIMADRHTLEDNAAVIVAESLRKRVLIIIPGDPLIATTHRSIITLARRTGARTIYLPGVSGVCTAKTVTGLDYYKFGKTLTLPGPWRMVKPYSVLEGVSFNLCGGLHTLLLLDINPNTGSQLDPCTGTRLLVDIEKEYGFDMLERLSYIIVERAGMPGMSVKVARGYKELCIYGIEAEPASIIIPGRLAHYEIEAIEAITGQHVSPNDPHISQACRLYEALKE